MKLILVLTTLLAGVFLANSQTPSYVTVDSYPSSPYRITTSATFQTYSYWQDQSSSTWSFCGKGTSKTCSQRPSVNGVTPPYTASNIFWGKAASSSGVSGMGFNGITKTSPCTPSGCKGKGIIPGGSTPIDIAQLVHYNYPIYSDTGLDYFQIVVQVTIETPDSVQGPYPFTFSFFINETLNSYSRSSCKSPSNGCCYFLLSSSADPCADKIYLIETAGKKPTSDNSNTGVGIDVSQTKNFLINGVNYTFAVLGFKDSPDAKGNAKYFFISDEKGATASYLFASLVPACPSSASCSAAGTSLVLNQGDLTVTPPIAPSCTCQCANTTDVGKGYCLKTGLTTNGCSCACDSGYCLNNGTGAITGTGSSQTCSCNCANSKCPVGKVVDSSRCNCVCDTSYCVQTSYQTSDCSCSCPSTLCKTPYVADARCNCLCSLTAASCTGDRNVFNSSSCSCLCKSASSCSTTNNTNWIIDQTTCGCVCPASMATTCAQTHQVYNATSCSCGACLPNYVQDTTTNQLCGKCNLTAATCTAQGYTFNSESCSCQQCTTPAVCDINLGLVNDNSNPCICRNCTVGECKCGNGRIEPGETCDDGANSTLCCQNCLLQSTCIQDPCYLVGSCSLNSNKVSVCVQDALKCVNSECQNSTCSSNGTCIYTALDYKACGTETNLCNQWCFGGVCVNRITSNTQAICNASETCKINDCNPATGQCAITNVPDGTACDDGDVCTGSTANPDKCNNGNCVSGDANGPCFGVASLGPCYILSCDKSNGRCIRTVITNGSCDDENPCTVNDRCTPNGLCHGSLLSCSTPETVAPTYPKAGETSDWSNFCSTLGSNSTVCQSTDATTIKETAIDQLCSTQDSICSSLPVFCNFVKVQVCSLKAYLDASEPVCRFRKCDTNTTSSTKGQCIPASYLLEGSSCDDGDNCTVGDACSKTGVCSSGTQNICAVPIGGGGSDNTPIIATSIAAGGALIAAAAAGFLVKRLMDASGLADPFTWGDLNPSTSAQNPLYEPAVSAHDNPLFAANT